MEDINATALSSSLVLVTWDIPYNLQWFPPGLDYSVRYQIMANWTDSSLYHVITISKQKEDKRNYNLD